MSKTLDRKPVQPLHTEHIHVEKKVSPWVWLLIPLVALAVLALGYYYNQAQPVAAPQAKAPIVGAAIVGDTRTVTYKGKIWEVKGAALSFPAGEVKLVNRSAEGDALYVHQEKGYLEAPNAKEVADTISTPSGRVYLKNPNGTYQPLFEKH